VLVGYGVFVGRTVLVAAGVFVEGTLVRVVVAVGGTDVAVLVGA
jgi:hypothetical protein